MRRCALKSIDVRSYDPIKYSQLPIATTLPRTFRFHLDLKLIKTELLNVFTIIIHLSKPTLLNLTYVGINLLILHNLTSLKKKFLTIAQISFDINDSSKNREIL